MLPERARACRVHASDPESAHRDSTAHLTHYRRRVEDALSGAFGVDVVLVHDPIRADWYAVRVGFATSEECFHCIVMPGTSNIFFILGP